MNTPTVDTQKVPLNLERRAGSGTSPVPSHSKIERIKRIASKMTVAPAGAKAHSPHRIVKLQDSKFTNGNCSENNRVYLWKNHDSPPYIRPVEGWEIIGYGKAPWPGNSKSFAVMLEKKTPAEEKNNIFAPDHIRFDEGTRIWAHLEERHFRELNDKLCGDGPTGGSDAS